MTYAPNTLLIACPDTEENLQSIRKFTHTKNLEKEDVKILRKNGLLELRARREISYG